MKIWGQGDFGMEISNLGSVWADFFWRNWETQKNWNYFTQKTQKLNTTITPQIEPLIASILVILMKGGGTQAGVAEQLQGGASCHVAAPSGWIEQSEDR